MRRDGAGRAPWRDVLEIRDALPARTPRIGPNGRYVPPRHRRSPAFTRARPVAARSTSRERRRATRKRAARFAPPPPPCSKASYPTVRAIGREPVRRRPAVHNYIGL
ncbi:hypothetical protein [Burkholderia pseudomallei]|uniref:hypothetical protein n=1 Tax=Burkholderia pseudomallei TaxID=28450 RepID=UPI0003F53FE3|nr:hypothetical protein [Burkholderia pseudomallei]